MRKKVLVVAVMLVVGLSLFWVNETQKARKIAQDGLGEALVGFVETHKKIVNGQ